MTGAIPVVGRAQRRRGRARARVGFVQGLVGIVYVLAGLAIATALAWPVYGTPRLALVAAVAAIPAVGVPLLVAWRRWPVWGGALLVAAAYLVLVVPVAIPSALASPIAVAIGVRDGVTGVVLGWKQLLTLETPLGEYQAVLVPFLVVALVGTTVATAFVVSSGARAAIAVPVVLLMSVFGIAFGDTSGGTPLVVAGLALGAPREVALGLLVLGLSLVWLVFRARLARRAALAQARADAGVSVSARAPLGVLARRRMLSVALLVVALAVGLVATPVLSGLTPRSTLRTAAEPLLVVRAQSSPLGQYRANFADSAFDTPLFTISLDEALGTRADVDRVRLAVLDDWDGEEFSVGAGDAGRFTRLPGGTPAAGAQPVRVTVARGLSGIWMPLPDGVTSAPRFTGPRAAALADGFYLDRDSGAGIEIAPGASGARGLRPGDGYTVDVPPTPRAPLGDPGSTSLIDLQSYPQLAAWIAAQHLPRTAAGFDDLVTRLRDRGYLTHALDDDGGAADWVSALSGYRFQAAYAGHSAAREEALFEQLTDQQNRMGPDADSDELVAGVGDDEQFATAAALVARAVGYESRVVVGVRLQPLQDSGVAACSGTCTGGDMAAWVEVRAPGSTDWTTVDTEPQYSRLPTLVTTGQELPRNATVPEQPEVATVQPPTAQHDDSRSQKPAHDPGAGLLGVLLPILRIVGIVLGILLLVLLPPIVLAVSKRLRRGARRRSPVPEVAVVGAWAELVDVWADGGVDAGGGTRRDQAVRLGSPSASRLAALADHAVFAEHPPTRQSVDEAWRLVDAEVARRAETLVGLRRLRAVVTPVSFLRALGWTPKPRASRDARKENR